MYSKNLITVILLLFAFSANAQTFEKHIKLQMPENGESRYTYVPFEVPENMESLSFEFEYDKKNGANKLEFGIFENGFTGKDNDKNGFRGWSGSVRDSAFISQNKATHGYLAGKIEPGKWYFIIGLAKIAPEGVDLTLKVKFNEIDEKPLKQFEAETTKKFSFNKSEKQNPLKINGLNWFRGDLHAHSFHGDGSWSVKAILESAKSNDLDFVALTEHNTYTHHKEIDAEAANYPNLLILRGEEVTTYSGHINVWGLPSGKWVDFRVLPNLESSAKQIAGEAHALGALASINHPTMKCDGCNWNYDNNWGNLDSVEIWNATWDADDEEALKIWDEFLQKGRYITAIGSTDSHYPPYEPSTYPINLTIGNPTVFIGAKTLNQKDLFEGIKKGRVFVTEKPQYTIKFIANKKYTIGDKIEFLKKRKINLQVSLSGFPSRLKMSLISDEGVFKELEISSGEFVKNFTFLPTNSSYVRLEIRDKEGKMLGFTNPIYFVHKEK